MSWLATPFLRFSALWHLLAVVLTLARPQQWGTALAAVALNHGVIAVACVWPRSQLLGPNIRRLPDRCAARRDIGLTFDDGPDPRVTAEVAEILDQYSATATFFCIGARVEQHPDTVASLITRGHSVENHTHNHRVHFALLGPKAAAAEIDAAQSAIARFAGVKPCYFRAPAGIRGPWLQSLLEQRGLHLASWTRRGFDTVTQNAETVVRRLTRGLAGGEILVLHDTAASCHPSGEPIVLTVLPRLLEELATLGLHARALPRPPLS